MSLRLHITSMHEMKSSESYKLRHETIDFGCDSDLCVFETSNGPSISNRSSFEMKKQ